MTETKKKALWACARCERKKEIPNVEADPVVLRVCDYCGIENWVRPVGHAGADTVHEGIAPQQTMTPEQAERHARGVEALKAGKDIRKAILGDAEAIPEENLTPENTTGEGEMPESIPEVEAVTEEDESVRQDEAEEAEKAAKEAEIARLKAELEALEGE